MAVPSLVKSEKAPRELFKNIAYDELRARFDNRLYPPGTFLSERQLAEELGMSKTPVKAALERLELEGFITVSPQSGIIVRELNLDEITQMYEMRLALDGFVLRSLAGRLTNEQLAKWELNLQRYAAAEGKTELLRDAVLLDAEFHLLPSQFLGNKLIINTMQQFSVQIFQVINRVFSRLPSRVSQSLIEHREIVNAVRQGKGDLARELGEIHLRVGHEVLVQAFEEAAKSPANEACL
jgi:DNA-binding GntR family transcriptional regulator